MSITVKFIRRRAGGRVTVRPTTYDKRELTIGRATDCDVFLPDLRVGLHHARFVLTGANRAMVEAQGDRRIKVKGSSQRRREISIDDGEKILIGPYQMTVEPGDNSDAELSLELVEPASDPIDPNTEKKVFSLRGTATDKRMTAWLFTLLFAGLFLAYPISNFYNHTPSAARDAGAIQPTKYTADRPWLSGEIASAHANLANDCKWCHEGAFTRVKDETCLSCHEDTRNHGAPENLALGTPNPHGGEKWLQQVRVALEIPEGRCGSCHFEHNGEQGIVPSDETLCTDCHRDLTTRIADVGLLDVAAFSAHPEFRPTVVKAAGETPTFERISLAQNPSENSGLIFPHDFHLKDPEVLRKLATLPEAVRRPFGDDMDCQGCHVLDAGGELFMPIEMERSCSACHSLAFSVTDAGTRLLPHGEPEQVRTVLRDFYLAEASKLVADDNEGSVFDRQLSAESRIRRERLREQAFADAERSTRRMVRQVFAEGGICEKCHTVETPEGGEDFDIADVALSDRFMPKSRFLHSAHMAGLECVACHKAETSAVSSDVLMPAIAECRDCHGKAQWQGGIASDCLTCHVYHSDTGAPHMTAARFTKPSD
jgi:predicted CXXCH cytochrome family protein